MKNRIVKDKPSMNPDPTIGSNYSLLKVEVISNGKKIERQVEIWDTAGQERYKSLVEL